MKYKILILENIKPVIENLKKRLSEYAEEKGYEFDYIVYKSETGVKDRINERKPEAFDVILLDKYDGKGGSFHEFDIAKFGPEKVIGISSIPSCNKELVSRGVEEMATKDMRNPDDFYQEVVEAVDRVIHRKTD